MASAEDVFVAAFYNFRGRLPEIMSTDMAAMVIGKPFQMKEVPLSAAELLPCTGFYETVDGGGIGYVTLDKGALYYQSRGGNKFRMVPCRQDAFIFDNTVSTAAFKNEGASYSLVIGNKRSSNSVHLKKTDKTLP